MLTGLIFATEEAADRPDTLAATLPFAGATLVEFQARTLIAAGVSHLLIAVGRVPPELQGAVNRIRRRGIAIDTVRTAADAVARAHPLSRVVVMADGLVTTEAAIAPLLDPAGPSDALLVTGERGAAAGLERIGAEAVWAGIAVIGVDRIAEVAALPQDYDFASALLRVTAQAGAAPIPLSAEAMAAGHGIERQSARLRTRSDAVIKGRLRRRTAWIDRLFQVPIARWALPRLAARGIGIAALSGGAGVLLAAGLALIAWDWHWVGIGMPLVVLANLLLMIGAVLAWMRDQPRSARLQSAAIALGSAAAMLTMSGTIATLSMTATAPVLAVVLIVVAGLAERAIDGRARRAWWGSPAAYPVLLLAFVWSGLGTLGLAVGAAYAAVTLAAAIEDLRRAAIDTAR